LVARQRVQVGQVWKNEITGENYLVTRVFAEGLATYAVLRKTGAEKEARLRVRVERDGTAERLPGFYFAQAPE
jgi:hypothetical protein